MAAYVSSSAGLGAGAPSAADEEKRERLELLTRLTALFDKHMPASARREHDGRGGGAYNSASESLAVPGPRWKGAGTFGAFLQSAGLLQARGVASAKANRGGTALARPDVDLVYLAVCGKNGAGMDVIDFMEALVKVAKKLWPDRGDSHPSELLQSLLDAYFPEAT